MGGNNMKAFTADFHCHADGAAGLPLFITDVDMGSMIDFIADQKGVAVTRCIPEHGQTGDNLHADAVTHTVQQVQIVAVIAGNLLQGDDIGVYCGLHIR